jgi:hypothetical protein
MASPFQPNLLLNNSHRVQPSAPASLRRAIEKLAAAGEQAGLSIPDMIAMLNAGLSVGELLDVIGYCLKKYASASSMNGRCA